MNRHEIVTAVPMAAVSGALFGWVERVATRLVQRAARNAPGPLAERLEEEWLAHLLERPRRLSRLSFAMGCMWAATLIEHEHCTVTVAAVPATSSPTGYRAPMAAAYRGKPSLLSRRTAAAAPSAVMCDINITPLIDVMLVLLVTLIITLPISTHAVKLDLTRGPPGALVDPPEPIDLEIQFDGTMVWNGRVIAGLAQLESSFNTEARKIPQSEIHLRPDRGVKYDVVAQIMASAQRSQMKRMSFANTTDFRN